MEDEQTKALATLNKGALSEIANILENLEASGAVKVSDIFPSLNKWLVASRPGATFAGKLRAVREGVMIPSIDDEDVLKACTDAEVQDLTGDLNKAVSNFYAGNRGQEAKLRNIKDAKFMVIMYKGQVAAENPRHNPWRDYLLLACDSAETALATKIDLDRAVKKLAK